MTTTEFASGSETTVSTQPNDYITLTQATHLPPRINGKRVNVSTIYRWIRKGINGIHLAHWRCGRKVVTTPTALQKFFTELAAADSSQIDKTHQTPTIRKRRPRPEKRQASIDAANVILRRAKIIV